MFRCRRLHRVKFVCITRDREPLVANLRCSRSKLSRLLGRRHLLPPISVVCDGAAQSSLHLRKFTVWINFYGFRQPCFFSVFFFSCRLTGTAFRLNFFTRLSCRTQTIWAAVFVCGSYVCASGSRIEKFETSSPVNGSFCDSGTNVRTSLRK